MYTYHLTMSKGDTIATVNAMLSNLLDAGAEEGWISYGFGVVADMIVIRSSVELDQPGLILVKDESNGQAE